MPLTDRFFRGEVYKLKKIAIDKKKILKPAAAVMLVLLASLLADVLISMRTVYVFSGEGRGIYPPAGGQAPELYSYGADGGSFFVTGDDPQMVFRGTGGLSEGAEIRFAAPAASDMKLQMFYDAGGGFSEAGSVTLKIKRGDTLVYADIPGGDYGAVRFDIDGSFTLESITLRESDPQTHLSAAPSAARTAVIAAVCAAVLAAVLIRRRTAASAGRLSRGELIFLAACGAFYFIWSVAKPFNYGPDEYMRYDVSLFMFNNNRLPAGAECLNPLHGFSYAHRPTYFCNLVSWVFMKAAALFSGDDFVILCAARFVSVLSGTAAVCFVMKSAKLLFDGPVKWVMTVFFALIPQYVFLTSYLNSDITALAGAAVIFYVWVLALKVKQRWDLKMSLLLAAGITVVGLSYYNAYGWVLMSIVIFCLYFVINREQRKSFLKYGIITAAVTLVFIAPPFIRQLVLYKDLLGLSTARYYGELYAIDELKPSARALTTVQGQGMSVMDMLVGMNWLKISFISYIGLFGYMNVPVHSYIYLSYFALISLSAVTVFLLAAKRTGKVIENKEYEKVIMNVSLTVTMVIPVILSIIFSYTGDFQAQGRYCYPAHPALAYFIAMAVKAVLEKINRKETEYAAAGALCSAIAATTAAVFFTVYLPS